MNVEYQRSTFNSEVTNSSDDNARCQRCRNSAFRNHGRGSLDPTFSPESGCKARNTTVFAAFSIRSVNIRPVAPHQHQPPGAHFIVGRWTLDVKRSLSSTPSGSSSRSAEHPSSEFPPDDRRRTARPRPGPPAFRHRGQPAATAWLIAVRSSRPLPIRVPRRQHAPISQLSGRWPWLLEVV